MKQIDEAIRELLDAWTCLSDDAISNLPTRLANTLNDFRIATQECPASLMVKGAHFPCEERYPHGGWAHSNRSAEAIWIDDRTSYATRDIFEG